jgi:hypothetical protein
MISKCVATSGGIDGRLAGGGDRSHGARGPVQDDNPMNAPHSTSRRPSGPAPSARRRAAALAAALCLAVLTACASLPATTAGVQSSPGQDVCHVNGTTYCAVNPAVTDANVRQTICNPSWTRNLRPPASLTEQWKREILTAYHLSGSVRDYEGDHRMPEADLGGDPGASLQGGRWVMTDQVVTLPSGVAVPANFADESPASPNPKDHDETALHDEVCAGRLTLTAARIQLRDRWLLAYPGYRT